MLINTVSDDFLMYTGFNLIFNINNNVFNIVNVDLQEQKYD